jgi:hypothetical protein
VGSGSRTCATEAAGARSVGFGVEADGLGRGTLPRGSGRQLDGAADEECPVLLVGTTGRQRDLDPGLHLGDSGRDFDQRETDGVELGLAPERGFGRQTTQRVQQPVGGGVGIARGRSRPGGDADWSRRDAVAPVTRLLSLNVTP